LNSHKAPGIHLVVLAIVDRSTSSLWFLVSRM
jgi:hypothetical protein